MASPYTHRCQTVAEGMAAVRGRRSIGFAIFPIDVWSSKPDVVRKSVSDVSLWRRAGGAVLEIGRPVFQTFNPSLPSIDEQVEWIVDTEGDQRWQAVLTSTPTGMTRESRSELHMVSEVFDLLVPDLSGAYRPRESAVMTGAQPTAPYTPKAQLQHSDNSVPDDENVQMLGAGAEAVGVWVWGFSHLIAKSYQASEHSLEDHKKACDKVKQLCPSPVYVLLQPGEMMMMHGNVIHAGAKLPDGSVTGCARVHKYMIPVSAPQTKYKEDFTVLLASIGMQNHLPPGTQSLDSVFELLFDRGAGGV